MQTDHSGDQINQRVDIQQIGTQFINFYYTNLKEDFQKFISCGIIKSHTRIRYCNVEYKEELLLQLFTQMNREFTFTMDEYNIMDSGGRRADIVVIGKLTVSTNPGKIFRFVQYFTIANNKDKNWFIHNSLLNILE